MDTTSTLMKAADFAAEKHKTQRRKDAAGTPYINHPLGVANILSSIGGITDVSVLAAAILHDTVEDTETTYEELVSNFGEDIANIVMEVTDDKSLDKVTRKKLQVIHAGTISRSARLVKLADKLYNLRDLQRELPAGWSVGLRDGYCVWAKACVSAMRGTNPALETELDVVFEEVAALGLRLYPMTLEQYYDLIQNGPPKPTVCFPSGFGGFR